MEYMQNRRKLKLYLLQSELLNNLGITGYEDTEEKEIELIIDVQESKELYKSLSNSDVIKDWDFIEEEEDEEIIPIKKPIASQEDSSEEEKLARSIQENLGIENIGEIAKLLEAFLIVGYKSPALKFDEALFKNQIRQKYNEINVSSAEQVVCKMILETYYLHISCLEALIDVIIKLKEIWISDKVSNYPTLASLTYKLFKK
jgi:hypothetical protein